jgi:putative methionine-R-sulfoxide reductase with GAF domain
MQAVVDALWSAFGDERGDVSWVGFYLGRPGDMELVLGPRRDKPACSPIGLHGVCGKGFLTGQAVIVEDVRDLGESYIACDPRDRSEAVVPLLASSGEPWGVLDLDSHTAGAFGRDDIDGLRRVLAAAGLSNQNT